MFRCLRPGCPTDCGTRNRPSCRDKTISLALVVVLTLVLFVSLRAGVKSLCRDALSSAIVSEPAPAAASQIAELVAQPQGD